MLVGRNGEKVCKKRGRATYWVGAGGGKTKKKPLNERQTKKGGEKGGTGRDHRRKALFPSQEKYLLVRGGCSPSGKGMNSKSEQRKGV